MSLLRSWRDLRSNNPEAIAMFFFGIGIGHLIIFFIYGRQVTPSYAPVQWIGWGAAYLLIGALHWRRR